jgi:hypothetical protein
MAKAETESLKTELASKAASLVDAETAVAEAVAGAVEARAWAEKEVACADAEATAAEARATVATTQVSKVQNALEKALAMEATARTTKEAEDRNIEKARVTTLQAKIESLQAELKSEAFARVRADEFAVKAVAGAENEVAAAKAESKAVSEMAAQMMKAAEANIAAVTSNGSSEARSALEAKVAAKAEKVAMLCIKLQDKVESLQAELEAEISARIEAELTVVGLESQLATEEVVEPKTNRASSADFARETMVAEKAEKVAILCMKLQADVQRLKAELAFESAARLEAVAVAATSAAEATVSKAWAKKEVAAAEDESKAVADRAAEASAQVLKLAQGLQKSELTTIPAKKDAGLLAAGFQFALDIAKGTAISLKEEMGGGSQAPTEKKWFSFGNNKPKEASKEEAANDRR